jgi:hypothetical protein
VDSEPGRGSTFTLWLSGAAGGEPAPGGPERRSAPARRGAVGPVLADAVRPVLAAWIERLRADPLVPRAAGLTTVELEDHMHAYLTDFAQQFVIIDEPSEPAPVRRGLVRDGADVRALLARLHGAQRAALGWDEAALAREFALLGEELERALAVRLADVPPGAVDDARALVRAWLAHAAREAADALRETRPGRGAAA